MLVYFMLKGEMPFGSWRESEIDTCAKIAKGQFTLPQNFSPEAVDLITKVLLLIITVNSYTVLSHTHTNKTLS